MRFLYSLPLLSLLLISCGQYGKVSYSESPQIINVSQYDPKEVQRSGSKFTTSDMSALKRNGAHGLIARIGKGTHLDTKAAQFLKAAERSKLLLGSYYYLLPSSSPSLQAELYIQRLRQIRFQQNLRTEKVLLVADIDTNCSISQISVFLKRIKDLTGVTPVVYLENGDPIRNTLNNASWSQKSFLRKHPYWLALYSNKHEKFKTPKQLAKGSGVWSDWAMWQYGGVWWKNGRSVPYHYNSGNWKTPKYFGDLAHPSERNGFNGSYSELIKFWDKHSWDFQ